MKPPALAVNQIRELGEPCHRFSIPQQWADANGHMNMRWYVALFDEAGDTLHARVGVTSGTMDLEHHTHFLKEVMPGSEITIYSRAVASNAKRFHYMMFLVDETRGALASIFECMNAYVDLRLRKTAAWPEPIRSKIEAMVEEHSRLSWKPPISGALSV